MTTFFGFPAKAFKTCIFILVLLAIGSPVAAQPWMNGGDSLKNFYDIQRNFNEYWKDRTIEKGKGYKQFKRWEWFWEQRVAPTGEFPNPMQLLMERPVLKDEDKKADRVLGTAITNPWSSIGPSQSTGGYSGIGRINCIAVHPTNANTIWAGTASGGLWKSTNGGSTWSTVTDLLPTLGVGDVAIDPVNTNTMYLATGDGNHFTAYSVGVLKSTDGGATWNTTGLNYNTTQTVRMTRILVNPTTPNTLIVAASNGIYRSTNGGTNWTQAIAGDFKDIEFKPGDPTILYAGRSNGAIYRSTNGGANWTLITNGLPTANAGRVALAVSIQDPTVVYALFANSATAGYLGLYLSTDSGLTWTLSSNTPNILDGSAAGTDVGGQGWYDLALAVSPTDAGEVYVGGINVWRSQDFGVSWTKLTHWYNMNGFATVHADQHCLYYPAGSRLYLGNDGGVYSTVTSGTSWSWIGNGIRSTQFYRLGSSATNGNKIIGGAQDNGSKLYNGTTWTDIYGGDGMEGAIDPTNENIIYATSQSGTLGRSVNGGTNFTTISPITTGGAWITPYMLNPQNPQAIYAGYVNVWKSLNRGSNWSQISSFSGSSSLNILKVAPSDSNTIYVSTGSGNIKRTTNGGGAWTTVNLPISNTLTSVAIHPTNPQKIWATFSGYSAGNKVYVSTNGGTNWTNISGTLPNIPVNCIVYQNNSPERLYIGTDVGVYYIDQTLTDWSDYNQNMPNVIVNELEIQYSAGKIRAATYGRGMWEASIISGGSIATGTVGPNACAGETLAVPFTISDLMNADNVFTVQLSSSIGSFNNPTEIGSLTGTGSGTIFATIPSNATTGNGYKVRVVSSNPILTGSPNPGTLTISAKPIPAISGTTNVCSGTSSKYTTSPPAGITILWVASGGTITGAANLDTVNVTWGAAGQASLKLIQTITAGGCSDSVTTAIIINPLPSVSFTGTMAVCPGSTSVYSSTASGEWTATNGTIIGQSTGPSVVVVWGKTGNGSLKLIQTSTGGCKDSLSQNISFKNNVLAAIAGDTSSCKNSSAVYTAKITSGVSYVWSVTGGTLTGSTSEQGVSVRWGNTSNGSIRLIQTDLTALCSDTSVIPVTLSSSPVVAISGNFDDITTGATASYTAAANPGGTNKWLASGGTITSGATGTTAQILWNTTGTASLKLIQSNANGCTDSAAQTFQIKPAATVSITGAASLCQNAEASYSVPLENGMSVTWLATGGQVKSSSGNSTVIIWQNSGAGLLKAIRTMTTPSFKDTVIYNVTVQPLPAKPVITGNSAMLTSSAASGNQWFRNGSEITGAVNKTYAPTISGLYTVQVTSQENCISPISDAIDILITAIENESEAGSRVVVTPNPAVGYISIQCPAANYENVLLKLVDVNGREVLKTQMTAGENLLKGDIDLHSVSNGTYFLSIQTALKTYTVKVSVSR